MNKVRATVWMAAITSLAVMLMTVVPAAVHQAKPTERTAQVKICRVETGCVEQITALAGVVRYEGEHAVLSPAAGIVSDVYVQPGQRVKAGDALFRLDGSMQEAAMAAAIAQEHQGLSALPQSLSGVAEAAAWGRAASLQEAAMALDALTVRAYADGVVQQVLVTENGGVAAGTPGVAISGEGQLIQCTAVLRDAQLLQTGMAARILYDDAVLCTATVRSIGQASVVNGQTVCTVELSPTAPIALPLGATVSAEVIRSRVENVPVLPVEAVRDQSVRWVAQGRSYRISTVPLMADERCCWVELPVGTEVILSGEDTLEGQRVREAEE